LLAALVVVTAFWALWRSVDVFIEVLLERPWAVDNHSARSLVAVTGNFSRVALAILGVLSTLGALGFPVTTAVAGLGIGGVALAFGAQKTVADLFGSVAIAADRPCRVGDTVRVEDVVGVVEVIGVRSTRIRTPDRSIVSFPNGRLADMRIETLAVRDRIRFATMVGVVYGTSEQQLKQVLTGLEDVLRRHPQIWKDVITVRFAGFGATALEIEVQCWFNTPDYELFRAYRQDVLFGFMKVIDQAGTAISWPTHTVQLVAPHANPS
jgi:MscS family membrane protein